MADPNIKRAFEKVKGDITNLQDAIKKQENAVLGQKNDLLSIKSLLEDLLKKNDKIEANLSFFNSSIGNRGVDDSQRQSTATDDNQQWTTIDDDSQQTTMEEAQETLDQPTVSRFKRLTDREFSTFLAVYELERLLGEVTYADLANKLNVTESTVRTNINELLNKKLPLTKKRFFNKKSFLGVKPPFNSHSVIAALMKARQDDNNQTSLSDL